MSLFCAPIGLNFMWSGRSRRWKSKTKMKWGSHRGESCTSSFLSYKTCETEVMKLLLLLLLLLSCRVAAAGKITFKSDCRSVWVLLGVCCSATGDEFTLRKQKPENCSALRCVWGHTFITQTWGRQHNRPATSKCWSWVSCAAFFC